MPVKSSDEMVLMGAYKTALNNKQILEDLLYYVHRSSFSVSSHATAYSEGERNLALRILRYAEIIE